MTGATMPAEIEKLRTLVQVEQLSKHAQKIFLVMIAGCAFSWLTILTTNDVALVSNSALSPLPVIGTKVPIADGRRLDETAFPWLPTGLVLLYVRLLKAHRPRFWSLQVVLSIILTWLIARPRASGETPDLFSPAARPLAPKHALRAKPKHPQGDSHTAFPSARPLLPLFPLPLTARSTPPSRGGSDRLTRDVGLPPARA